MRVVVGVDGSKGAERALAFAVREAELRGATLEVVHALRPREAFYPYAMVGEPLPEPSAVREAAEAMLREMTAAAEIPPTVKVETEVVEGPSATVLTERADGADLLVVGSRGRGGFAGLLLGSVSQQCVQHADTPVVVVPAAKE